MKTTLRLLIIAAITSVFGLANAGAINVSYGETAVNGVRHDGKSTPIGRAQTVTIEANLDSPDDVEKAANYASSLVSDVDSDRVSLLEVTNEDKPLSARAEATLKSLRAKVSEGRRVTFVLSKVAIKNLARGTAAFGIKTAKTAYGAVTSTSKLSIMALRFVSASGAVYVGVSLAANLPLSVDRYIQMLNDTSWTGGLSAAFVMFSDAYESVILDRAYFANKFDESERLQAIYKKFKAALFKGEGNQTTSEAVSESNPGLWLDQFLKGQALEVFFVATSNLKTAGLNSTLHNIPAMLVGSGEGGIGQSLFDQSINILMRDRIDKLMTSMPDGAARDAKIKRTKIYRDIGLAVNSFAQVWMVMLATRGNVPMKIALHFYVLAGGYARVKVAPLENRLNEKEKARSPTPPKSTGPTSKIRAPIFSRLRCEALFTT